MKSPIPFGKYYLLDRINIGGMAEVFQAKAFGVEGFERFVAVKKILPSIAEDAEFISMFIDEAKICVQLNHANIAQIFDLGKVGDSYFIAMEYVSGQDARAVFNRARKLGRNIPLEIACYVGLRVCEGLDYAHNKKDSFGRELNIIHRDVSPQNILVSNEGEVKIIDFGIAKAANKASRTQAGILKGKFGYMSPEQVRGLPFDKRSDIFSTGIVLYELLTCERLFLGETDFSTLEKVRNVDIVPPREHNPLISPELERITLKSLARSPEDRYQTAMEFHSELQHYLFTSGTLCTRKELTDYMKLTFAKEIDKERRKHEEWQKLLKEKKPATPPNLPLPPKLPPLTDHRHVSDRRPDGDEAVNREKQGSQVIRAKVRADLSWDEDEIETHVFDKEVHKMPNALQERLEEPHSVVKRPGNELTRNRPQPIPARTERNAPKGTPSLSSRFRPYIVLLIVTLVALVVAGAYIIIHIVKQRGKPETPPKPPNEGVLSLKVTPVGTATPGAFQAAITVDDKVVFTGSTLEKRFSMKLAPGKHTISVSSPGFHTQRVSLDVEAQTKIVHDILLVAIPKRRPPPPKRKDVETGRLIFGNLPTGAAVTINDKVVAITANSPITLRPGRYNISVSPADGENFQPFTTSVVIKAGEIAPPIAVTFRIKRVLLTITSTPPRVSLVIKDAQGKKVFSGRRPDKSITLKPHEPYTFEVYRRRYDAQRRTATFTTVSASLDFTLKRSEPDSDNKKLKDKKLRDKKLKDKKLKDKKLKDKKLKDKKLKSPQNVVSQFGLLSVNARPAAMVLVNGVRLGVTPLLNRRLKAGAYTLTLIAILTKQKKTIRITIKPGGTTKRFVAIGTP